MGKMGKMDKMGTMGKMGPVDVSVGEGVEMQRRSGRW